MIHEVRSKVTTAPVSNYTVAVCDQCGAACEASRLPGRKGRKASDEAITLAHGHGWADRTVPTRRGPRSRKMTWDVQLLCPACQAVPESRP